MSMFETSPYADHRYKERFSCLFRFVRCRLAVEFIAIMQALHLLHSGKSDILPVEASLPEFVEGICLAGDLHIVGDQNDTPALLVLPA